jgi:hypothetical protein
MRAGFSFSYPPISLLLGQPLSIKKSYAGAIQIISDSCNFFKCLAILCFELAFENPRSNWT